MSRFYRDFEDKFRGSREVIRARLDQYIPFLQISVDRNPSPFAVDLGCGRGEWLDVVEQMGFRAVGVDLDDEMLDAARSNGKEVRLDDALNYLRAIEDNKVDLISAFHLVEHLPFDQVRQLIAEAYRALAPGGLVILETPNPENLSVGTLTFHLDPTHQKPLPPDLLHFAVEFEGFNPAIVLRLQEDPRLRTEAPTIRDVLYGASPDYAVVGQKPEHEERGAPKDVFRRWTGVTTVTLADRFQEAADGKISQLVEATQHTKSELSQQGEVLREIRVELENDRKELELERARQNDALRDIRVQIENDRKELLQVYRSWSWRVTKPARHARSLLRQAGDFVGWMKEGGKAWVMLKPGSRPRRVAGRLARAGAAHLRKRPRAKQVVIRLTSLMPSLQARLYKLAGALSAGVGVPHLQDLEGREWYLEPEPEMKSKWKSLLASKKTER